MVLIQTRIAAVLQLWLPGLPAYLDNGWLNSNYRSGVISLLCGYGERAISTVNCITAAE